MPSELIPIGFLLSGEIPPLPVSGQTTPHQHRFNQPSLSGTVIGPTDQKPSTASGAPTAIGSEVAFP